MLVVGVLPLKVGSCLPAISPAGRRVRAVSASEVVSVVQITMYISMLCIHVHLFFVLRFSRARRTIFIGSVWQVFLHRGLGGERGWTVLGGLRSKWNERGEQTGARCTAQRGEAPQPKSRRVNGKEIER